MGMISLIAWLIPFGLAAVVWSLLSGVEGNKRLWLNLAAFVVACLAMVLVAG